MSHLLDTYVKRHTKISRFHIDNFLDDKKEKQAKVLKEKKQAERKKIKEKEKRLTQSVIPVTPIQDLVNTKQCCTLYMHADDIEKQMRDIRRQIEEAKRNTQDKYL